MKQFLINDPIYKRVLVVIINNEEALKKENQKIEGVLLDGFDNANLSGWIRKVYNKEVFRYSVLYSRFGDLPTICHEVAHFCFDTMENAQVEEVGFHEAYCYYYAFIISEIIKRKDFKFKKEEGK